MRNSKLYSVLSQLDKIEQNRFRKYIESPYFNRSEELVQLFEILIAEINEDHQHALEKKALWSEIEPEREYDDVRFRKYCSDLLKLLEGFLAQEVFENKPMHHYYFLMEAIGKKKIEILHNSVRRGAERKLEKHPFRDPEYFFLRYETEKNYAFMTKSYLKRTSMNNLNEIVQNLDRFYISEKLRLYQEFTSIKDNVAYQDKKENNFVLIEPITDFLSDSEYNSVPAVDIYFQSFLISENFDNEKHYYNLKNLLNKHSLLFPQEEAYNVYNSAINYCINKINKGNQNFLGELFDLFKDLIDKEIIFVNGEISPWDFRNIVVIALRLGKFEWTKNFIENYNDKIPSEYRENAVSFNLATLYFYQKNYSKVIQLLQTVEYEDFSYNLNSKAMLIATYYEMDEIEPLYSLFESFRVYLNRHKGIPENRRKNFKNLIRFTKKLTRIIPGDEKAIKKLKEEIVETKNIASIGWLKEKIAELE